MLLLALVSTGCQSFDFSDRFNLNRRIPWKRDEKEIRQGVPVRIVTTWSDAVLHRPGEMERGFGGRLYFYDNKGGDPIEVEGQLVVYAFDETNRDPTNNRPDRRYVFPPGQFEQHKSTSDLGMSYSVWLPWDTKQDGPPADVSLIARFEPLGKGNLVTSDQTLQRLPGQGPMPGGDTAIAQEVTKPGVQQAKVTRSTLEPERNVVEQTNYETSISHVTPPSESATKMTTTSISLPNKYQRLNSAAPHNMEPRVPAQVPVDTGAANQLPTVNSAEDIDFVGTRVSVLTEGESVRRSLPPRSSYSRPASPQVPTTPASR
jgi:hypothetical protein